TAFAVPGVNFNRYAYAANNPYRFTDPDGRQVRNSGELPHRQNDCGGPGAPYCVPRPSFEEGTPSDVPSRRVGTITSTKGETRKDFVLRAGQQMRNASDASGHETCGTVCPS